MANGSRHTGSHGCLGFSGARSGPRCRLWSEVWGHQAGPSVPACLPPAPPPRLLQLRLRLWAGLLLPWSLHGRPPPSPLGTARPCLGAGQWSFLGEAGLALTSHSFPLSIPGSKSSGSTRSAGGSSRRALGREQEHQRPRAGGSGSESDHTAPSRAGGGGWWERPASQLSRGSSPHSQASTTAPGLPPLHPLTKAYSVVGGPPGGPPVRELAAVPPELTGSRQSFQKAMGNPCEFFVDIM